MWTLLAGGSFAAAGFVIAAVAVIIAAILWAVLPPVRLVFRLFFGLVWVALGLMLVPILFVVAAVVVLIAWAAHQAVTRRTSPAI